MKKTKDSNAENKEMSLFQQIVSTGLSFALSASLLDMILGIVYQKPGALSSLFLIFLPMAVTLVILLAVYIASCYLLLPFFTRFFKLSRPGFLVALAVFIGLSFVFATLSGIVELFFNLSRFFILVMTIVIAFIFSINSYSITRMVLTRSKSHRIGTTLSISIPLLIFFSLLYAWIVIYKSVWIKALPKPFFILLFVVLIQGFIFITYRKLRQTKVAIILGLSSFLLAISGIISAITGVSRPDTEFYTEGRVQSSIKRVLFITIDALRPDYLSCYNPNTPPTPNIDQIASEGTLFEHTYSVTPWTLPSFASIMTGLPPRVHGTTQVINCIPDTLETLAEMMKKSGYYTAVVGESPFISQKHGTLHGFMEFHVYMKGSIGFTLGSKILMRYLAPERFRFRASTKDLTEMTMDWIDKNENKDFFFWLHYFDPHAPYTPPNQYLPDIDLPSEMESGFNKARMLRLGFFSPDAFMRECIQILYGSEVLYVDDCIGKLMSHLEKLGLYDETLIIITSDHGEELFERGFVGHGSSVYNEQIHVPLIIKLPRSIKNDKPWRRVGEKVSSLNIMPTVLDLCSMLPSYKQLPATSLSPFLGIGKKPFQEQPVVSSLRYNFDRRESVIFDNTKYIRSLVSDHEELYNLKNDSGEQYRVDRLYPERVKRGKSILDIYDVNNTSLKKLFGIRSQDDIELDPETLKRLEALGYIR